MISTASRRRLSGVSGTTASPGGRIAAIRAVTALMYEDDEDESPRAIVSALPKPATKAPAVAVPAKPAPTPAPKPAAVKPNPAPQTVAEIARTVKVPDDVKAKGPAYATAWAEAFVQENQRLGRQIRRLRDHPAAVGRAGALLELIAAGKSDEEIKAQLPYQASDKQRRIDATWERAIIAVCGSLRAPEASRSADVWERAYAKINSEHRR